MAATAPAFPASKPYVYGNNNSSIKKFQDQMHSRSSFPAGTGQFGPLTLTMVKRLQSENGLSQTGQIDAKTWSMAWNGRYIDP
jgi:peptidoglycan hydrolase-like protein with peptidoglycan-binding domain